MLTTFTNKMFLQVKRVIGVGVQEEVFVSPRKLLEQQQLWVSFAPFSGFWPILLKSSHKVAFLLITLSSSALLHRSSLQSVLHPGYSP